MNKSALLFIGMLSLAVLSMAQSGDQDKYVFRNYVPSGLLAKIDITLIEQHYLGESISRKMQLFNITYTYIVQIDESTDRLQYRKPAIYYSIKKIDSYYKKGVKKGYITEDVAQKNLEKFLDISLAIFPQDTETLESVLKNARDEQQVIEILNEVVLN